MRGLVIAELALIGMGVTTAPHVWTAVLPILICKPEREQVLHIFVVALELNLVVVELVRHQVKPAPRLLQDDVQGHLDAEVGDEVEEGDDDQRIVDELVGHQVEDLQEENEAVEPEDHVGPADLELELRALLERLSQHHDGVEVEEHAHQSEEEIEHGPADIDFHHEVVIVDQASGEHVKDEVEAEAGDQGEE